MSPDPWTLGLEVVNFLVLVWLLERLLYRPVLGVIERRQAEIDDLRRSDEEAESTLAEARARLAREREMLGASREQALEEAHARAREERAALLAEAREEADRILASARARVVDERAEAARALRHKSAELAVAMARRLLETKASAQDDLGFLDAIVEQLEHADVRAQARLLAGNGAGDEVRTVSARPLDDAARARCVERLSAAVGGPLQVVFDADPALVAGLEVHFPGLVLRHSWRSALEELGAALDASAEAGEGTGAGEAAGAEERVGTAPDDGSAP